MALCLTFVFLGLLEFAFVNVLTRAGTKSDKSETNLDEKMVETSKQQRECRLNNVSSTFQSYEKQKQNVCLITQSC
jgi:hypothetical protein